MSVDLAAPRSPEPRRERFAQDLSPGESFRVPLDLGPLVERLRAELREEIREAVRAELDAATWPEWMEVRTAARYLDVPVERLSKLKRRREIPHYQEAPGCRVFFRRSELDEWMTEFRTDRAGPRLKTLEGRTRRAR